MRYFNFQWHPSWYDAVRKLGERLFHRLPSAQWQYSAPHVTGKVAFLEWTAHDEGAAVEDGADSFVLEKEKSLRKRSTTPFGMLTDERRARSQASTYTGFLGGSK